MSNVSSRPRHFRTVVVYICETNARGTAEISGVKLAIQARKAIEAGEDNHFGTKGAELSRGPQASRPRTAHNLAPNRFPREPDANACRLISLRGCEKIPWQGLPAAAPECCGWKPRHDFRSPRKATI